MAIIDEAQKIIEDYDDHREENRRKEEEAVTQTLEALKGVIESNQRYLKYAQAKGWFKLTLEEEVATATHNALTTIISRTINFEIGQARKLAFEILQDVNDHDQARRVADLLGLTLKSHELE